MSEVNSQSWKLRNAIVTIHDFSAGTAILNITVTTGPTPSHAAVWVSPTELRELASAFNNYAADMGAK